MFQHCRAAIALDVSSFCFACRCWNNTSAGGGKFTALQRQTATWGTTCRIGYIFSAGEALSQIAE